jgi:hypothetical protein
LNMNMNQFSQAAALSVGRCHFKGHLLWPELVKNSVYERSRNKEHCKVQGSHNDVAENTALLGCGTVLLSKQCCIHLP